MKIKRLREKGEYGCTCMITTGLMADGVPTVEGVRGQETVTLEEAEIPAAGVEEGITLVNS